MNNLDDAIRQVNKHYPWLTEATMDKCLVVSDARLKNIRSALSNQKNKSSEMEDFINEIEETFTNKANDRSERARKFVNVVGRINDDANDVIRSFERADSPVLAMGEGFETFSWAAYDATEALADGTRVIPYVGPLSKLLSWGSLATAGMATVGVFMTKFILEHEKVVRAFIDYGAAAGDLETYTTLRDI